MLVIIWNKESIDFLKENYANCEWDYLLENLKPLTKNQIIQKASRLGIKKNNPLSKPFTNTEIKILKDNYNKMTIRELQTKFLPNRTESSLMTKANRLGLVSREKWTDQENELLKLIYSNQLNDYIVSKYFPNRTVSAIQSQADKLGLKKFHCRRDYSEEFLIDHLKQFALEIGRTPSGEDIKGNDNIPSLMTYHRYFGSYARACELAGLEVNHVRLYGKDSYYLSSNNDICLSKAELIITEALIDNGINYKKEVYYADIIDDKRCRNKRCDWLIDDSIIVEYFGMPEKEYYKEKMIQKIEICKDNNITLLQLFRKDLNKLHNVIRQIKTLSQAKTVTTER